MEYRRGEREVEEYDRDGVEDQGIEERNVWKRERDGGDERGMEERREGFHFI